MTNEVYTVTSKIFWKPSKFRGDSRLDQAQKEMGRCFKCSARCDLCKKILIQDSKFKSFATGRIYNITQRLRPSPPEDQAGVIHAISPMFDETWPD